MAAIETALETWEGDKRHYIPGVVVQDSCPECGLLAERDLGDRYLNYPQINGVSPVFLHCPDRDCQREWEVPVIVRVTVELAPTSPAPQAEAAEGVTS